MTSVEPPVPSSEEPVGARPVLPSGVEAGLVAGLAVAAVFLVRDVATGAPMQTPSVLGTLLIEGPEAALRIVSAPGAAIAYNAIHFAVWVVAGMIGISMMRQVEESASNWYRPWLAAGIVAAGCFTMSVRAAGAGLPSLHLWLGTLVGVAALGAFLGWRHPRAMRRIRGMGAE